MSTLTAARRLTIVRRTFSTLHPSFQWQNTKCSVPENSSITKEITSEYLVKILSSRVYEAAHETKTAHAPNLSSFLKNDCYLKREDTQPVFSFKIRGAHNKIASLSKEQLAKGVVTCSAGNHAQGVAFSSGNMKIKATIVMPETTPAIKVSAVKRFGGDTVTVLLHGSTYDEAAAEAKRLVVERGLTLVHPFDDPHVIAGQGTIGMEVLKALQAKDIDSIFMACGGGGMLAGVAAFVKALRPEIKVIGVEAYDAAGMTESLAAGKVVTLPSVGLFADGAAVKTVGTETFRVCDSLVDGMITVDNDEICAAIKLCFNDTRSVLEPAGALGIAGMVKYAQQEGVTGKTMVAITSGANMDFDRLRFVSERADASETLMAVSIPERSGAIREFYKLIYPRNVTELSYRWSDPEWADIVVSLQTLKGSVLEQDKEHVLNTLSTRGYLVHDFSANELAKAHIRHLAGGRPGRDLFRTGPTKIVANSRNMGGNSGSGERTEVVYRFEFPESPGALGRFVFALTDFNRDWNISLFHYRNHGHDLGRVLVGLVVLKDEVVDLRSFVEKLGYVHYEETDNAAFTHFLK